MSVEAPNTSGVEPITPLLEAVRGLDPVSAAARLGEHSPDMIRDVLSTLDADQAIAIAAHLPGSSSRSEHETATVIDAVTGTVGELTVHAEGALPADTTVAGALDFMVNADPQTHFTYLYAVDDDYCLTGIVPMKELLLARPGQRLSEIMTANPFSMSSDTPVSEATHEALRRRHRVYPVVDGGGVLLGVVPGWRLFERMASELGAQPGSMVGLDREERVTTPLMTAFRMRHPWLQLNLLTAFAAAFVVGFFEDTISQIVALAVFLPVLAGQSGNTGCQALAITLRGLTLGELADFPVNKLLRKEITLGALNGFFVGLIAAAAMWIYAAATDTADAALLALTILIAMVGACVSSGIFGVLVPLTLRRFGADPATASSIFLTTFTDTIGMGLMLFLATALVL